MKCTACKKGTLISSSIEGLFRAHICSHCGGDWILIEDFVSWRELHPNYEFEREPDFKELPAVEKKEAILCPVTHTIMRKFRISANNSHKLNYSSAIGGLWLDKGEWQLLIHEGLAGSLNALVTDAWQRKIRQTSAQEHLGHIYRDRFGEEVYTQIKEMRDWLQTQPHKADLKAYLISEDPYSAKR